MFSREWELKLRMWRPVLWRRSTLLTYQAVRWHIPEHCNLKGGNIPHIQKPHKKLSSVNFTSIHNHEGQNCTAGHSFSRRIFMTTTGRHWSQFWADRVLFTAWKYVCQNCLLILSSFYYESFLRRSYRFISNFRSLRSGARTPAIL